MKRQVWLLLMAVVWPLCGQEWTEKALLEAFRSQGPAAAEVRARKAVAEAEARTRGLYANPSVQYNHEGAGLTQFWQVEQALPIAGRQKAQRAAAAANVGVVEAEGASALWQMETNLRVAFLRVLVGQEREAIWKSALETVESVTRQLRNREQEGEGSRYDRLRAEREAAGLAAELRVAQAETALARAAVKAFLPASVVFEKAQGSLEAALRSAEAGGLLATAKAKREDLLAERRRAQQFALEAQAAARLKVPEPLAHLGLKRADIAVPGNVYPGNGIAFGVSVPLPVFQNGKQLVEQNEAEARRVRARLEVMERQVAASIDGLLEAYATRRAARDGFEQQVRGAGGELIRIAKVAYEEGELGILQLLDAYRTQWQAEMRSLDLRAAVKEAQLELERVVGEEIGQ